MIRLEGTIGGLDPRRVRRLWSYVVAFGAIAVVCLACGHVYVSGDGLMSAALAAAVVSHFSSGVKPIEAAGTVLLGVILFIVMGPALDLGGIQIMFDRSVSALGLASLAMQVARLTRMRSAQWISERGGYAALTMLTPMFSLAFASSIALPGMLRTDLLDGFVFNFDRVLFADSSPPLVVGRFLTDHRWLAGCATFFYWAPQPLNIVVYLAERRRHLQGDLITTLLVAGFVGYAFFPCFPVVGPGYVLRGFPYVASMLPQIGALPLNVPRNCMPSLHMANAIILAAATWRLGGSGWKALGIIDVVFTVIATLGFGYHYATDLIAAVPFTCGVIGATRRDTRTVIIGGALTVMFLVVVRYAA
jgi:hypothetical protein